MYRALLILMLAAAIASGAGKVHHGEASWYTAKRGQRIASGVGFNPDRLEAAHKKLSFGTVVEVKRLDTGAKVRCVITDRGPYIKGRIIDLTPAAAEKINMIRAGVVKVEMKIIKLGDCRTMSQCNKRPFKRGAKTK